MLEPPEQSEMRIHIFRNRKQQIGETITTFYSTLKCLANEAYPTMPPDCLDVIMKEQFVQGLLNEQLKFQVKVKLPSSSAEALSVALSLEPIVPHTPVLTAPTGDTQAPSTSHDSPLIQVVLDRLDTIASRLEPRERQRFRRRDNQPRVCWNCGKAGHLRQQCTQSAPQKPLN